MSKDLITFVIFTYNEERRIEHVLKAFAGYGKLLLVDSFSTDATVEIARKYGANIYQRINTAGFSEEENEVQRILDKADTDWVYWGYADEICAPKLLKAFIDVSKQNKYKIVKFRRRNVHYGIEKLYLDNAAQNRFFRKGIIDFKGNRIHSFGKNLCSDNEILTLPMTDEYSLYHFSTYNVSKFEINHSGYSDVEARHNFNKGKHFTLKGLLLQPFKIFVKYYLVNGGWKAGVPGLIMTMQYCFFRFNTMAKTWELENNVTLETIEKKYDALKQKFFEESNKLTSKAVSFPRKRESSAD